MPRRDHCARMISSNKYLLIYGGKNDQAFNYESDKTGDIMEKTCLNDICLFSFETFEWTTVAQMGFCPVGRWNASMTYSEETQQLFIFGGSSHKGGCKNDIYCFELNPNRVREKEAEFRKALDDVYFIHNAVYALKNKTKA